MSTEGTGRADSVCFLDDKWRQTDHSHVVIFTIFSHSQVSWLYGRYKFRRPTWIRWLDIQGAFQIPIWSYWSATLQKFWYGWDSTRKEFWGDILGSWVYICICQTELHRYVSLAERRLQTPTVPASAGASIIIHFLQAISTILSRCFIIILFRSIRRADNYCHRHTTSKENTSSNFKEFPPVFILQMVCISNLLQWKTSRWLFSLQTSCLHAQSF